jgi:hypothetical protein
MNIQEAVKEYLNDETCENICNDSFDPPLKLIGDRGTRRLYHSNGINFHVTMGHLASNGWYLVRNQ